MFCSGSRSSICPLMTYADAVAELESILLALQQAPDDIDGLHARVARAEQLLAACREKLHNVEADLSKLRQTAEE